MSNIYVPDPNLTARQIEVAQKLYELRSEKAAKLDRVAEIDAEAPALETEWKQIQEELTLGLFGMVVRLEAAPPAPEPEVAEDAPVEAAEGETATEASDAPAPTDAPAEAVPAA